jgi:hypothetical protein
LQSLPVGRHSRVLVRAPLPHVLLHALQFDHSVKNVVVVVVVDVVVVVVVVVLVVVHTQVLHSSVWVVSVSHSVPEGE